MTTYGSQQEKDADKARLDKAREGLGISTSALCLDDSQLWQLKGKRGRITTWGDGIAYLLHVYERGSVRADTFARKRLAEVGIEIPRASNMYRFDLPVTPEQAAEVRELAGLRRALSEERLAALAEHGRKRGFGGANYFPDWMVDQPD